MYLCMHYDEIEIIKRYHCLIERCEVFVWMSLIKHTPAETGRAIRRKCARFEEPHEPHFPSEHYRFLNLYRLWIDHRLMASSMGKKISVTQNNKPSWKRVCVVDSKFIWELRWPLGGKMDIFEAICGLKKKDDIASSFYSKKYSGDRGAYSMMIMAYV